MLKLPKSLGDTIANSKLEGINTELSDLIAETTEKSLNELVNDGLRDLPVLRTLLTFPRIYQGISSYLLIKKIALFLTQLDSINLEERKKFVKDMENSKKEKIFENLILVLERIDDMSKAKLIGELFKSYILKIINETEYLEMVHLTNTMNLPAIEYLIDYYTKPNNIEESAKFYYATLGLLTIDTSTVGTFDSVGIKFHTNSMGSKYASILKHLV